MFGKLVCQRAFAGEDEAQRVIADAQLVCHLANCYSPVFHLPFNCLNSRHVPMIRAICSHVKWLVNKKNEKNNKKRAFCLDR